MIKAFTIAAGPALLAALILMADPTAADDDIDYFLEPPPAVETFGVPGDDAYYPDNQDGDNGFEYFGGEIDGGYGYQNNDGSWFHQGSGAAGGYSVGGDGSGCIYTPDWSNC